MSGHEAPPANGGANVESLKRVRQIELEAAAKLAQLKASGDAALKQLGDEAAAAVHQARTEAEAWRTGFLAKARAAAEAEAAGLLAEGGKAAREIEERTTQSVAAKRDAVLKTVLGAFRDA